MDTRGVEPLQTGAWRPGQPILYLIPDSVRLSQNRFRDLDLSRRPNVARLDSPTGLWLAAEGNETLPPGYAISNETGGQIDYYLIDTETNSPVLIKTGYPVADAAYPYFADETSLFAAKDEVFPRGEEEGEKIQ